MCWDILASFDVSAQRAPDGGGWRNELFVPDAQRLHPTREACWRADGFELLLEWFNTEFAPATHLALYGEKGRWTEALLAWEGTLIRRGGLVENHGSLQHLLPIHEGRMLRAGFPSNDLV